MDELKFTLTSCPSQIEKLELFIKRVTSSCQIKKAKHPEILISLTEAVNNAIIHGNNEDKNKKVNILCRESSKKITFYISDEGSGFDPNGVKDPTKIENIELCGGRGVHIMKELSDKLAYHDNGRTVELQFKLKA